MLPIARRMASAIEAITGTRYRRSCSISTIAAINIVSRSADKKRSVISMPSARADRSGEKHSHSPYTNVRVTRTKIVRCHWMEYRTLSGMRKTSETAIITDGSMSEKSLV